MAQAPSPLSGVHNQAIADWMVAEGFENIQQAYYSDTTFISWENRRYRYQVRALARIINDMPLPSSKMVIFLPKLLNNPMLAIQVEREALSEYRAGRLSSHDLAAAMQWRLNADYESWMLRNSRNLNRSYYKVDLSAEPIIQLQLGNYDRPIRAVLNIGPTAHIQLAKGLVFTGQALVPVYNNFTEDNWRAGVITLSQNFRLPGNLFVSVSTGYFTRKRVGGQLRVKNFSRNGRIGFEITLGYTTYSTISDKLISDFFEKDEYFLGRVSLDYRLPEYNLILKGSYGTFMIEDQGWRFDALRQFGETYMGFYGVFTTGITNAGFNVSVPLVPKKYLKINSVRVRPGHRFNYEYKYRGQTFAGLDYETGDNIVGRALDFNPDFMKNHLAEEMEALK